MDRVAISNIVSSSAEPVRGLFTSTVADSPNLRTILPAMIRDKNAIDVVFVYRDHLTVREQVGFDESDDELETDDDGPQRYTETDSSETGRLDLMLTKNDFDSIITCARILTLESPDRENKLFRPRTPYDLISRTRDATPSRTTSRSPEAPSNGNTSSPISQESHTYEIPPQVLVLTLRRGKRDSIALMFLIGERPDWRWVCHQRILPIPSFYFEDEERRESLALTAHLALEPCGRAIAVAAHEERVIFYSLKRKSADWFSPSKESANGNGGAGELGNDFDPFAESHQFQVNGTILKMEFLQTKPKAEEGDVVVLLLVVRFNEKETQLQRWDWNINTSLRYGLTQVWTGAPLDARLSKPDLLIPSAIGFGFFLVTERFLARYQLDNVDATGPRPSVVSNLPALKSESRSINRCLPNTDVTWMTWARPARQARFTYDHFYITRRDGQFCFLEIPSDSEVGPTRSDMRLGKAHDTAFAVIFNSYGSHELIVTSAGFFALAAREEPGMLQRYRDWSPVGDLTISPNAAEMILTSLTSPDRISFIHTALEAVTWHVFSQHPQVHKQWILPGHDAHSRLLLSSTDSDTQYEYMTFSKSDDMPMAGDGVEEIFDTGSKTLAAGYTSKGAFVQVTPSEIRATIGKGKDRSLKFERAATSACLDAESGSVLLFVPDSSTPALHLMSVDVEDDTLGINSGNESGSHGLSLDDQIKDITCMSLNVAEDGSILAAVSTWDNDLLIITVNPEGEMSLAKTLSCEVPCESIVIEKLPNGFLAVIGLRNGDVRYVELDNSVAHVVHEATHCIGQGSVKLLAIPGGVLALYDGRLCKLERGIQKDRIFQQRVSLSETKHIEISEMCLMPGSPLEDPWIAFFSLSKIIFSTLRKAKTFCRPRFLFAKEDEYNLNQITRVLPYDNCLAVAYEYTCLDPPGASPSSNGIGNRQRFARLGFVRPRSSKVLTNDNTHTIGKSGAEIQDMFKWSVEIEGKKWRFLVIRTLNPPRNGHVQESGRLLIYTVDTKGEQSTVTIRSKIKRDAPIDAAAVYSQDSIVISSNNVIQVMTMTRNNTSGRFHWTRGSFQKDVHMTSMALRVGISPNGNKLVYMTNQNQLTLFEDHTKRRWESESYTGMGQIHLTASGSASIALALSQDGLLGLWAEPITTDSVWRDSLKTLFRANLQNQLVHMTPLGEGWYVGSTALGQLCQVKVLTEDEWKLLRYVQNIAEQDRSVCPFSWKDGLDDQLKHPKNPLDPSILRSTKAKTALMHINGDILRRVTAENLKEHLIPNAKIHNYEIDLSTAEGRTALLEKLAHKVLPRLDGDQLHGQVVEWIRTFWQPRV